MNKESNIFKNIIAVLLTLLILGLAVGTMSASQQAGNGPDTGSNVTLNATSATGINASVNTVSGANITVYFNTTNASATSWNINATNQSVSINGINPGQNGTIASNGTFTLNSSVPTPYFNVTVTNAGNSSENATLTGFWFVAPVNLGTAGTFGILSSTFTRNGGITAITGDLGYTTLSGSGTHTITNGATFVPAPAQAGTDQGAALSALASQACTFTFTSGAVNLATDSTHGTIGVYTPGAYCITGAATIGSARINLSGAGTYIFRVVGALDSVANSNVTLVNGASASDVFWTPTALTTLAANTMFVGTVIDDAGITVGANTNWTGRALAFAGTVTTDTNVITSPSFSSTTPVNFVTSVPIRMLTGSGAATRYPTNVYYYYNGKTISINVSLNQQNLNVSGDFSRVGNASLINTSDSFLNDTGEYIYTLTAIAGNVGMGGYPINITAINTTTGAFNISAIPPVAVMNINPQTMNAKFGGTNWTTEIADFTNATLTIEKYNDSSRSVMLGKIEFLTPMNLADNTTATALLNLGTNNNMNMAATSMSLNSSVDALAAMNVSSRLSAYNLTNFTTSPAIFMDGVLIALPDNSSGGAASNISWNQTTQTLTLNVSHWTSYSWGTFGINLTNISALSNTTTAGTNATYIMSLQNNGTANDTYNLTVVNNGASTANLSVVSPLFVAAGATETFRLNVTNAISGGTFLVNVTATSVNYSDRTASVNTTTTVLTTNGTNLTNISLLTQTVFLSTNATYTFRIHNNGSLTDNYTINISSNPNNATVGLNITSPVMITSGAIRIFTLNVSNASSGIFRVNITVNSTNDPNKRGYANTTTNVTTVAGSVRLPVDLGTAGDFVILSKSGISTTGTTNIVGDIGVSPIDSTAITGFGLSLVGTYSTSSLVTGKVYAADYDPPTPINMGITIGDMETAYTAAAGRTNPDATELYDGDISGRTLYPGLYKWSSGVLINSPGLTLDCQGNTNAVFIFQIAQTLTVGSGAIVTLSGGCQANNIFWQVADQTTLGTTSDFKGTILDYTAIVIETGATLNGRALAQTAVTLDGNAIREPTPPTVSSTIPTILATDVANNSAITATFSEAMNESTVTNVTFNLKNGSAVVNGAVTYSGVTATFTPDINLNASTTYTATITTGVKDLAGNTLAVNKMWTFTTGATPDITAPTVISTDPANLTTGVANNSAISATFSEALNVSTVTNVTFTLKNGSTVVNGAVTYSGVTATFTPDINLNASTTYTATITTGVKDLAGNPLASNYTWSFTAGATADTTRPMVISTIPDNLTTGVAISSAITATFNESMNPLTITTATFTLKQGTTPVNGTVTYSNRTAVFTPASNLAAGTTYTATITTGVKDLAGNLAVSKVWTFTTAATTTTTSSGGGSGGGTGGSGVVTSEPYDNIAKSESYDKNLIANMSVTYTFKAPELGIYEIAVTGKENENDITLRVELLKGTSKLVTVQAPGIVYKNVNVWAGSKRIKEALIRFKVENSWLTLNNLAGSDIKLVKWDGSRWVQLETSEKSKDASFTYFEAKSDSLSNFAITGLKGGVVVPTATPPPGATPVKTTETSPAPTPAPTKKAPGFELVLAAASLCAIYLFGKKGR